MNIFEKELRRLAKLCVGVKEPLFAGRACYADLGGDNRVKLQFVTLGHADHYEAVKATILNRSEGEVDTLLFRFGDIWGKKQVSNPNFREGIIPHIWTDERKNDWYVYHPTDGDMWQLAAVISGYLNVFAVRAPERKQDHAQADEKESVVKKLREGKREAKEKPAPQKAPQKDSPSQDHGLER